MPKTILFLIIGFLLALGFAVFAAPIGRVERSILPETDARFFIGSTTPSALRWADILTWNLTASNTVMADYFTAASSSATSTAANGWNLTGGCFAVNGTCITGGTGATPGGFNRDVQFNSSGVFGGESAFTYNSASNLLSVFGEIASQYFTATSTTDTSTFAGSVGISTTSPFANAKLVVANWPAFVSLGDDENNALAYFFDGTYTIRLADNENNIAASFMGGNVGVGTTSPFTNFSVAGEAAANNFTAVATAGTSTYKGGLNVSLNGGCFAIGGVCLFQKANTWSALQTFADAMLKIPQGANPTVNAAGLIAHDTTANQFLYGADPQVLTASSTLSRTIEALAATDDNLLLWTADRAVTLLSVGCRYEGTGTTVASIALEDSAGNAMTHTAPTCVTGASNAAMQTITAGGSLILGEGLRMDVTNSPAPETDTYSIFWTYKEDRL